MARRKRSDHDHKRNGPPWKSAFAGKQDCDREESDRKYQVLNLPQLAQQQHRTFEKIVPAAGNAEKARQLSHNDRQSGASFEPDQDAVADQAHQDAQTKKP